MSDFSPRSASLRIDAQDEKAHAERQRPRKSANARQVRRKRGQACSCGCGQKTAATTRQRRLQCTMCGCPLRMTRAWLERVGAPACACGGSFVPDCLEDRARLPGADGEEAWHELSTRMTVSAMQSERGQRAGEVRAMREGRAERPALADDVLALAMPAAEYARHLATKTDDMPF